MNFIAGIKSCDKLQVQEQVRQSRVLAGRFHKTVLINRAVPGSGKTSFTRRISSAVEQLGLSVAVHSTDDFFMVDGRYEFDIEKLGAYHRRNLGNFRASLEKSVDLVIVDNTDIAPWECEPYTQLARAAGYRIVIFNFLPRELEKHLAAQQVTPEKPDAHGVSEESLRKFIRDFYIYNDLLDRDFVPDPKVHVNHVWDETAKCLRVVDEPIRHFDCDAVFVIDPNEYHALKEKIGSFFIAKFMQTNIIWE